MRHEICSYCGRQFANEAAYEHHLKPDMTCMNDEEMASSDGFSHAISGWSHTAPKIKRFRLSKKRPQDVLF